jgi:hypothetical protein
MPQISEDGSTNNALRKRPTQGPQEYESRSQKELEDCRPLHEHNHSLPDAPGSGGFDHQASIVAARFRDSHDGDHAPIAFELIRRSAAAAAQDAQLPDPPLIAGGYRRKADKVLACFGRRTETLPWMKTNLRRYYDESGIENDNRAIEWQKRETDHDFVRVPGSGSPASVAGRRFQ